MSSPCALCQRLFDPEHLDHIHLHRAASLEQQDSELLQTLMSSTTGRRLHGSLAVEVNTIKVLLREARNTGGFAGVLLFVRALRLQIEVSSFVSEFLLLV